MIPVKDQVYERIHDFEQLVDDDYKHCIEKKGKHEDFYKYLHAKNSGDEALLNLWGFNKNEIMSSAETISGKSYGQP